jgi:hypothetical protein
MLPLAVIDRTEKMSVVATSSTMSLATEPAGSAGVAAVVLAALAEAALNAIAMN